MKKVLWLSRHPLDEDAIKALKGELGEFELVQENVVFPADGREAFEEVFRLKRQHQADVVGGVFPAQFYAYALWLVAGPQGRAEGNRFFVVVSVPAPAGADGQRRFKFDHLEWFEL